MTRRGIRVQSMRESALQRWGRLGRWSLLCISLWMTPLQLQAAGQKTVAPKSSPAGSPVKAPPKKSTPAPAPNTTAHTPAQPALTVLPLLGLGDAAALAPNLTGLLFTELRRFEGVELRIRKPQAPLTGSCITSLPCLVNVGTALESQRLLVGVVTPRSGAFSLTLLAVDVQTQKPLRGGTVELKGDTAGYASLMRPVVEQIAVAAGARLSTSEEPPAPTRQSLESLIASAPASTTPAESASAPEPVRVEPSSNKQTTLNGEDVAEARKQQKARAKDLERQAEIESRERERTRREEEKRRLQRQKEEEIELERKRREDLKAAELRAKEELKWQKAVQANRDENIKRLAKGLPPLPDPAKPALLTGETTAAAGGNGEKSASRPTVQPKNSASAASGSAGTATAAEKSSPTASTGKTGGGKSSARNSARNSAKNSTPTVVANPKAVSEAEVASLIAEPKASKDNFLETEAPWMVGAGSGSTSLVGFALVDATLNVGYAPLAWLWAEASVGSLHGYDPQLLRWFYLLDGRVGAVVRGGEGRLHPFGGVDIVGLLFGPGALALGGQARVGIDVMALEDSGVRLELSLGAVHSGKLAEEPYVYPSGTQALFQFGISVQHRF